MFVRLTGRNGCVREYYALVDFQADYCTLPAVDAYRLGYPEAARMPTEVTQPNLIKIVTHLGYADAPMIKMKEVSIGTILVKDVEFLAFDIFQGNGYDVMLGKTLLKDFNVNVDGARKRLSVQRVQM